MEPINIHRGIVATLNRSNVDTDAIIPKQFLKSIARTGFGPSAFYDWRYVVNGDDNPDFELNEARFEGRSILVTRNNFGCGSSREHAVWALVQDGYKIIIAPRKEVGAEVIPGFADIFKNKTTKNGVLAIELSSDEVDQIFAAVDAKEGLEAPVNLEEQTVTVHAEEELRFAFDIEPGIKNQLIKGLDDIGLSLEHAEDITQFEGIHNTYIAAQ